MQLVWIALGITALFGAVILFGLHTREARMARNLQLRAQDLWAPFAQSGLERDSLLYGVFQDRSTTQIEMLVRNAKDEQVGRVVFHAISRTGAITISTDTATFAVDVLPTWSQCMVLRSERGSPDALCTSKRLWWGARRFDAREVGILVSRLRHRLRLAPISSISLDGAQVGVSQHVGGAFDRGVLLLLPASIPLPIRMFVLALQ